MMLSTYELPVIYFVLILKLGNKVYEWMHTATFGGNSYCPCTWFFWRSLFFATAAPLIEKGMLEKSS